MGGEGNLRRLGFSDLIRGLRIAKPRVEKSKHKSTPEKAFVH